MKKLDRDAAALLLLGALAALLLAPFWARGLTPFWGDLTYIHRPWRLFDVQALQAGRLPLWDPYLYFGMPAAASMQDAVFYPGTAPFLFFRFAAATVLFELVHFWLAAALSFLWLRSFKLRRSAAALGAVVFAFCGVMVAGEQFLNHLAVLALLPAVLLAPRRPALGAVALALAFLAGYPPFWLGACLLLALAFWASRPSRPLGCALRWAGVVAGSCALSAVLLFPAVELDLLSRRSAGVGLTEALRFGFSFRDLAGWLEPALSGRAFDPGVFWWTACWVGVVGFATALYGLGRLRRPWALALIGWLGLVALLSLGESFGLSRWLWAHLPPLRLVRYPGNLCYLAVPALALAAAAGAQKARRPLGALLALAAAAELLTLGWLGAKAAPPSLWERPGAAVAALQARLDGHRYLLSPRALEAETGRGLEDWAQRLYGLTNAAYRLPAAADFGDPLVPRGNYELMDKLLSAPSARDASALFPWCDILYLLTPAPVAGAPALRPEGQALWSFARFAGAPAPSRAYWLSPQEGETFPEEIVPPGLDDARPLPVQTFSREDRLSVAGQTPAGWIYLSQPRYPGWQAYLETALGAGSLVAAPALGAFEKFAVPAGPWRLTLVYRPGSFAAGLWLSVLAWLLLFSVGLRRLRTAGEPRRDAAVKFSA